MALVVNVNDLVDCKNFDYSSLIGKPFPKPFSESLSISLLQNTHSITAERVDKILEDETITTKSGRTHRHLIRWKRKELIVDSWLDKGDLQRSDPVQHGRSKQSNSTESSLLPSRKNDADI